ncbi:MAG: DnaA/Hda family protein, partial [Bacteroidales bacterium]|nr:DnaA/Hda family protein [Bacteroidales bacterium]
KAPIPSKIGDEKDKWTIEELEKLILKYYAWQVQERGRKFIWDRFTRYNIRRAAEWLKNDSKDGLFLYGEVGTGKTTLMRSLYQVLHDDFNRCVDIGSASQLVELFQHRDIDSYPFEYEKNVDFLFIDDAGVEPDYCCIWGTEYEPMRDLLAYRYDARKHTVISSNLGDEELALKYGVRIFDRILETYDRIT